MSNTLLLPLFFILLGWFGCAALAIYLVNIDIKKKYPDQLPPNDFWVSIVTCSVLTGPCALIASLTMMLFHEGHKRY